jgi:hypothetical protein
MIKFINLMKVQLMNPKATLSILVLAALLQACEQTTPPVETTNTAPPVEASVKAEPAAPAVSEKFPDAVYWGDTHVHTSYSMDAGAFGNTLDPNEAYRFARGEKVTASMGEEAQLIRPLDFLVVADHSDNMGMVSDLYAGSENIVADPMGQQFYEDLKAGKNHEVAIEIIKQFSQGTLPAALTYDPESKPYGDAWARTMAAAEKYNEPGKFTAFLGYEWTSLIKGNNMHRVVIYRDGADLGGQMVPYTTTAPYGSPNPRDLWNWMQRYEDTTGGKLLAIAHNGNLANGIMFPLEAQYDGVALDKEYVQTRIRWEPLYEVTQMKGDGETHPILSPDDVFADYETWDLGNLDASVAKSDDMLAGEYGREALKRGLELEARLGTNPYKFGLIGSTDTHTSLASTEESNFFGKMSTMEPSPERMTSVLAMGAAGTIYYREAVASGLAAVWATDNTREAIFDAMQRKETYASTGPRVQVRVFAGWDFSEADLRSDDFVKLGYSKGVSMGGDLSAATDGQVPRLMIAALKDPDGGNLDRLQVVKGWMDADGKTQEQVYDVACGGDRTLEEHGCSAPVGNTVDKATATYTNSIGAPSLDAIWTDPEFDASQMAFYYVRVIEIPTPRWTTFDAVRYSIPLPDDVPVSQQDRAYTSPIWYTP